MDKRPFNITDAARGAAIAVRIVPRADRDGIAAIEEDGSVKIRLTAPPVEGQVNEALVRYLVALLGVEADDIEILAGEDSRKRLVTLMNASSAEVDRAFREAPERGG